MRKAIGNGDPMQRVNYLIHCTPRGHENRKMVEILIISMGLEAVLGQWEFFTDQNIRDRLT